MTTTNKDSQAFKIPVRPLHNPLTNEDLAALEYVLTRLPIAQDMLHRAAACGLDVADRLARHEVHCTVAKALKEKWDPPELPTTSE